MTNAASQVRAIHQLARLHGVQLSYVDMAGRQQEASPKALSAVLEALGSPVTTGADVAQSLRTARRLRWQRCLEPVTVCWDGKPTRLPVRLPWRVVNGKHEIRLQLENGETVDLSKKRRTERGLTPISVDGTDYFAITLLLPGLPLGYHQLEVESIDGTFRSMVISAPTQSFSDPASGGSWGVFLPVYAAHSSRSWGAGNFSDWQKLGEWAGSIGGNFAASLPLLAAFLGSPTCEPSPYSPASRLFWNEFYLDIANVPEFIGSKEAQTLAGSPAFRRRIAALRRRKEIDYGRESQIRREVLEHMARSFFTANSPRRTAFERFLRQRPEVLDYARFRATCEKARVSWHSWPDRQRNGTLKWGDYDESAVQYHSYVQWLAQDQIDSLLQACGARGVKVYLDLPLGVHPDGYDMWRERAVFASGANAGAPPDAFFSKGQDWGFAPLHPQKCREQGYRYVLDYLRFQMRHAGLLRIDHVMGLHRLYWVPQGMGPQEGAYVNYPADELYALLCLESVRHKTALVGEDLGTVPPQVNARMKRHRLRRMYVVQFEQRPDPVEPLRSPPPRCVASLNTHDMPTFAAHWEGKDLSDRAELGLISPHDLGRERRRRQKLNAVLVKFFRRHGNLGVKASTVSVLRACLRWLSASPAEMVLINLEDLWLEEAPQNVPGTSRERPNWRRKARFTVEEIIADPEIRALLEEVERLRKD